MIVQEQDYLMHDAFLQHYGVPGMKWGVRKSRGTMNAYNQMLRAKKAKKAAGKASRKAYSDAYNYSSRHIISQYFGKNKKTSDSKWATSTKAMQKSNKADDAYKKAKKAYKDSYKKDKATAKSAIKEAKAAKKQAQKLADKAQRESNRNFYIWGNKDRQKELDNKMIDAYKAANKAEANYKRVKKKYKR